MCRRLGQEGKAFRRQPCVAVLPPGLIPACTSPRPFHRTNNNAGAGTRRQHILRHPLWPACAIRLRLPVLRRVDKWSPLGRQDHDNYDHNYNHIHNEHNDDSNYNACSVHAQHYNKARRGGTGWQSGKKKVALGSSMRRGARSPWVNPPLSLVPAVYSSQRGAAYARISAPDGNRCAAERSPAVQVLHWRHLIQISRMERRRT